MSFPQVLRRITVELDRSGIAYMLSGSFASAYYGSPRSTQDIDFVIEATALQLRKFIEMLPSREYYSDLNAALESFQRESMFNVIDLDTGWKIDMIFRKSRAFSKEEFVRRRLLTIEGMPLYIASAEDVVIAKLEWAKLAQSARQIEDAAGILRVRGAELDRTYLENWIRGLELTTEWQAAQRLAQL
jgi:hypothetical protein